LVIGDRQIQQQHGRSHWVAPLVASFLPPPETPQMLESGHIFKIEPVIFIKSVMIHQPGTA
jgi:hypothetical protein